MAGAGTVSFISVFLALSVPANADVKLFDGQHGALFRSVRFTDTCYEALDTPLRCPSVVERMAQPGYNLGQLGNHGSDFESV